MSSKTDVCRDCEICELFETGVQYEECDPPCYQQPSGESQAKLTSPEPFPSNTFIKNTPFNSSTKPRA